VKLSYWQVISLLIDILINMFKKIVWCVTAAVAVCVTHADYNT
jgi:hypothetical protein